MSESLGITILNNMAGRDFEAALDRHVQLNLTTLDLKEGIFGKRIADLSEAEAERADSLIRARGLAVYALSTDLFADDIEQGEAHFGEAHLGRLERVLATARILQPRAIRLVAAATGRRAEPGNAVQRARAQAPWLFEHYRAAIAQVAECGFRTVIENETRNCIIGTPAEANAFFELVRTGDDCTFTWDVVNMWQAGVFPSVDVYRALQPNLGYLHLKGGQVEPPSTDLAWQSALADASWPVAEIVGAVVADGCVECLCLNPPHGRRRAGDSAADWLERDVAYLRGLLDKRRHGEERR